MMINAIKNPIGCFKNNFKNIELQREAELLKNQPPSNVYYPNTKNNNNNLLITTTNNYSSSPFTNTSNFISNTTDDISYLFQQEDYFNSFITNTDNLNNSNNNTNPLYPYCSYSSYTNDYDDDYGPILSTFSSSPVDEEVMIPFNDYELNTASTYHPSLKRQRPYVDPLPSFPRSDNFAFNNNDGCYSNPLSNCCCPNSQVDQFLLPSPTNTTCTTTTPNEVSIAQPAYSDYGGDGYVEVSNVKKPNSGYLSSVAARERRRKISDKTQQLGKLVPGGSKLNTADMFHAAYKYIKFLQAQIGVLEFMGSIQEKKMDCLTPHLGVLLTSLPIQEKLYADEKCLVSTVVLKLCAKN